MRLAMLGWGSVPRAPQTPAGPGRPAGEPVPLERARIRGAGCLTGMVHPIPPTALPRIPATAVAYRRGRPPAPIHDRPARGAAPVRLQRTPVGEGAPGC